MKVVWLGSGFINRPASGTAQTARKAIVNLSNNYQDVEITVLVKSEHEFRVALIDPDLSKCKILLMDSRKRKFLSSSRQFYRFCWENRNKELFDIIHFSVPRVYPLFNFFPAKKFVATFHAGGDVTVPADKFVLSRHIYNIIIKIQWKKFDAIIGDSNFAVGEISQAYKIPVDKILKVFLGADNLWGLSELNPTDKLRNIVIVGRWQKYKNVHTALMAVLNLNKKLKTPFKVILVGHSNKLGHSLVQNVVDEYKGKNIQIINYLSDQKLADLYRESAIVIHPSINEGFGLPAFEAFGEGANLIVHNTTPAAELLTQFRGVIAENLEKVEEVEKALINVLPINAASIPERRAFINSIGATWKSLAANYYSIYIKLLSV